MSDELVDDGTKSLSVTHDSQGVVPVMYVFTCSLRCIHKHFLVFSGFNSFTKMFPSYRTCGTVPCPLIGRTRWLGGGEKKIYFLTAGPNSCTHTHSLDATSKRKDGSDWEFISFQRRDLW